MISSDYSNVYIKTMLAVSTVYPFYLPNISTGHEMDAQFAHKQHTVWTDAAQAFCNHDSQIQAITPSLWL